MHTKTGLSLAGTAIILTLIAAIFTISACTNTGTNNAAGPISRAAQPNFQVVGLGVNPASVNPGEEVQVIAIITNSGNGDGEYTADLKVNGVTDEIRKLNLRAGARQDITFRLSRDIPQIYQVKMGEIAGQFVVNTQQQNTAATGASCCSPAGSGNATSTTAATSASGPSCCSPAGSGTSALAGNPSTGQPSAGQPPTSQRRSCCQ